MSKYKVAYVTGSRADYGIVKNYLKLLNNDKEIDFSILVTGSHLEKKYGYSVETIIEDGFFIEYKASLNIETTNNSNVIHSMALALDSFGSYFETNRYALLIILGDRYEMMAVAIAASMHKIPILHLHGGEVTYGNYDEFIRHSITKMSQYHFTSTESYKNRVIQLGENPNRVFNMGALGAENCCNIDIAKVKKEILELCAKTYWVVAFHPETLTEGKMVEQVREVLIALSKIRVEHKIFFIGTNADTKSDIIRSAWLEFTKEHLNSQYVENLNVDSYLYLVKNSLGLIGNSSSGIIEAPSLGVYSVNIGERQKGRVHGNSVLDVECNEAIITKAMNKILENIGEKIENPYYMENTAIRYYQKTKQLLLKDIVVQKEFYDL